MTIKKDLLKILACPACHGVLEHDDEKDMLNCTKCRRNYPIRDGIPIMLVEDSTLSNQ